MSDTFDTLPVDPSNPGQFFACCGLIQVAALIDPHVTARFEGDVFRMSVPASDALRALLGATLTPVRLPENSRRAKGGTPDKIAPLHLAIDQQRLVVDWWLDDGVSDFKTWSGGQSASGAALAMHAAIREMGVTPDVLDRAVPAAAQPYYYDCRTGGNAIDRGFMEANLTTLTYAGTELLAFIGLQCFRPAKGEGRWGRRYATWSADLPLALTPAVASSALPQLAADSWRFEMTWRDASGRYKSFGRGHREPSSSPLLQEHPSHG